MTGTTAKALPVVTPAERVEDAIAEFDRLLQAREAKEAASFFTETLSDLVKEAARLMSKTGDLKGDERVVRRLHDHMMTAIAAPDTADGKAVRQQLFGSVLHRRMQDAERYLIADDLKTKAYGALSATSVDTLRNQVSAIDNQMDLQKVLASLPDKHRKLILMLAAGSEYAKIAEALAVDVRTLFNYRRAIAEARPDLRDLLRG